MVVTPFFLNHSMLVIASGLILSSRTKIASGFKLDNGFSTSIGLALETKTKTLKPSASNPSHFLIIFSYDLWSCYVPSP